MKTIDGKVALVTGAGAGIGRATALALAAAGARVAVADLDAVAAKDTAETIARAGGTVTTHQVDVTSEAGVGELIEAVLAEHGALDIMVNNAGIAAEPTRLVDVPLDHIRRVMDVNFWGMVHGSRCALPHLLTRPEASLVNVSSNAGLFAYSRNTAYSASKFAIRGFTEALRMELSRTPVRVTVVFPGFTKTNLMGNSPLMDAERRRGLQAVVDANWGRPPAAVAQAIVGGIRKGKPRVITGPDTVVLDALARLFPGGYSRLLSRPLDMVLDKNAVDDSLN